MPFTLTKNLPTNFSSPIYNNIRFEHDLLKNNTQFFQSQNDEKRGSKVNERHI